MNWKIDFKNLFKKGPQSAQTKKNSFFSADSLAKNLPLMLWVFLAIVALSVVWVIYGEIKKVTGLGADNNAAQAQTIRVNQEKYKQLEDKLDSDSHFIPQSVPEASVFAAPPDTSKKKN